MNTLRNHPKTALLVLAGSALLAAPYCPEKARCGGWRPLKATAGIPA